MTLPRDRENPSFRNETLIHRYVKSPVFSEETLEVAGYEVRNLWEDEDQNRWIRIHQQAFSIKIPWNPRRFVHEFCHKPWWNSSRMWFVIDQSTGQAVGTVTLGEQGELEERCGTVQWLAILPAYHRRGLGRLLMNTLENEAHRLGYARLELETLGSWVAANRFYQESGWRRMDCE